MINQLIAFGFSLLILIAVLGAPYILFKLEEWSDKVGTHE